MNAVVFPVVYHDKFYRDVLDAGELAKLAYYNDIVVGAVCCRGDTSAKSGERKRPARLRQVRLWYLHNGRQT